MKIADDGIIEMDTSVMFMIILVTLLKELVSGLILLEGDDEQNFWPRTS